MAKQLTAHPVCRVEELPPGERKIVEIAGRSIGVFNVDGEFHAIRNACPHQLAPLCRGTVSGTTLPSRPNEFQYGCEGRIIRCPWHGWEFDLTTGQSVFNPHKVRVKSYQVAVEPQDPAHRDEPTRTVDADAPDPAVETYEVGVEDRVVVLYL